MFQSIFNNLCILTGISLVIVIALNTIFYKVCKKSQYTQTLKNLLKLFTFYKRIMIIFGALIIMPSIEEMFMSNVKTFLDWLCLNYTIYISAFLFGLLHSYNYILAFERLMIIQMTVCFICGIIFRHAENLGLAIVYHIYYDMMTLLTGYLYCKIFPHPKGTEKDVDSDEDEDVDIYNIPRIVFVRNRSCSYPLMNIKRPEYEVVRAENEKTMDVYCELDKKINNIKCKTELVGVLDTDIGSSSDKSE